MTELSHFEQARLIQRNIIRIRRENMARMYKIDSAAAYDGPKRESQARAHVSTLHDRANTNAGYANALAYARTLMQKP
jgi:hypothetical protein